MPECILAGALGGVVAFVVLLVLADCVTWRREG